MHGNSRLPQLGLLVAGAVLILCTAGQSQSTPQRVLGPEAVTARGMEKPNLPGPDSDSIISPDDGPIPNLSILPAGPASPSPADAIHRHVPCADIVYENYQAVSAAFRTPGRPSDREHLIVERCSDSIRDSPRPASVDHAATARLRVF